MGLLDDIKGEISKKGISVLTGKEKELEQACNAMFYNDKDIQNETSFVNMVMTRGFETQERVGLHASSITKGSDKDFCYRQQVLSLLYKQNQGENVPANLARIFEEGNAIHEKWQRLFIRSGYAEWYDCDRTQFNDDYMISFTPDIICFMPQLHDDYMIGEIKSMNSWAYEKSLTHTEGQKQLLWYLHLSGLKRGFVLAENKNTQAFRIELIEYDEEKVKPFVERAENTKLAYTNFINGFDGLPENKFSRTDKKCQQCSMFDACYDTGMGRIPIKEG